MLTIYIWYSVIFFVFFLVVLLATHRDKPVSGEAGLGFIILCMPVMNVVIPVLLILMLTKKKGG